MINNSTILNDCIDSLPQILVLGTVELAVNELSPWDSRAGDSVKHSQFCDDCLLYES